MITADQFTLAQIATCASDCQECHELCVESNSDHALDRCVEITRNCSVFCKFTLLSIKEDVDHADVYLCICADICNRCAAQLEKFDYSFCLHCALICRQCAAACLAMVDDAVLNEGDKSRLQYVMQ
jgi:hypothetical protein